MQIQLTQDELAAQRQHPCEHDCCWVDEDSFCIDTRGYSRKPHSERMSQYYVDKYLKSTGPYVPVV